MDFANQNVSQQPAAPAVDTASISNEVDAAAAAHRTHPMYIHIVNRIRGFSFDAEMEKRALDELDETVKEFGTEILDEIAQDGPAMAADPETTLAIANGCILDYTKSPAYWPREDAKKCIADFIQLGGCSTNSIGCLTVKRDGSEFTTVTAVVDGVEKTEQLHRVAVFAYKP